MPREHRTSGILNPGNIEPQERLRTLGTSKLGIIEPREHRTLGTLNPANTEPEFTVTYLGTSNTGTGEPCTHPEPLK